MGKACMKMEVSYFWSNLQFCIQAVLWEKYVLFKTNAENELQSRLSSLPSNPIEEFLSSLSRYCYSQYDSKLG